MFEVFGGRELLFEVILKWCVSREKGEGRRECCSPEGYEKKVSTFTGREALRSDTCFLLKNTF